MLKGGAAAGPSSAAEQAPGGRNKAGKAAAAKGPSPSNLPPPPPAALLRLPDVFVGFNMGLTCPEYSGWGHTLRAIKWCDLRVEMNAAGHHESVRAPSFWEGLGAPTL